MIMATRRFALIWVAGLALASWLVQTPPVRADGAARALGILKKSIEIEGQVPLKGEVATVLQLEEEQCIVRYRVLQKPPYMFRLEYLEPQVLEGQLVVCDGSTRWLYDQQSKIAFLSAAPDQFSLKRERMKDLNTIRRRFDVNLLGVGTIVGRDAYVIQLVRKRAPLTSRKFWVDTQTFVVLRNERLAADGSLLAAKGFVSVDLSPDELDDASFSFEPPEGAQTISEPAPFFVAYDPLEAQKRVGFQIRLPQMLPPDFYLQDVCLVDFKGRPVAWLRYTDSLNYVSVFERLLPPGASPPSEPPHPQMVVGKVGDLNVVIVGTLPVEFLFWVANSLPP